MRFGVIKWKAQKRGIYLFQKPRGGFGGAGGGKEGKQGPLCPTGEVAIPKEGAPVGTDMTLQRTAAFVLGSFFEIASRG
jgi:hypothetical protein